MATNPDEVVSVGTASTQRHDADAVVSVGGSGNNSPADQVKAINGVALQRSGFWADFGQGTGGVGGILKAPFTESIPAELAKAAYHDPMTYVLGGVPGLVYKKFNEFLHSDDSKPLGQRMQESFGALHQQVKQHPGVAVGSLVKGFAADPELFFLPGAGELKAAASVSKAALAAGAGARAARVAGAVAGGAARAGGAAAIGGGAELAREMGENQPLDPGALGVSTVVGALAGGVLQVHPKAAKMTPEEIDRFLVPSAQTGGEPHPQPTVTPTAEGYRVHSPGSAEGRTFPDRASAEAAAKEISEVASAYRSMGAVPRGTTERHRLLAENPFTPEKMAQMVKRPGVDTKMSGRELAAFWGKAAVSAGIGAGIGAWLDRADPGTGAAFGAGITLVPRALPKDRRISIEEAINERNGQLAVMARKTLQFKAAIDSEVPEPLRRNAISLALEKHPGVTLNAAEQRVADNVRQFFDAMGNTAVDAGVLKELLHDYVSHIVEEDPEAKAQGTVDKIVDALMGTSRASTQSGKQFAQERRYATFGELQQALRGSGLRIKTGDVGEIVSIYSKAMFRTITDRRLLEALKQTPVEGKPPFLMPKDQVPGQASSDPRLERQPLEGQAGEVQPKLPNTGSGETLPSIQTQAQGRVPAGGQPPAGKADPSGAGSAPPPPEGGFQLPPEPPPGEAAERFKRRPPSMLLQPMDKADSNYVVLPNRQLSGYAVHKDIAPQLNFIFSAKDPNDVTLGLMALNQASKRAIVSFSLFHAKSLTDAFIGAQGTKAFTRGKSDVQAALKMFRGGGEKDPQIDALLKNGLQVQLPEDASTDHLHGALSRVADVVDKALPVSAATKGVKAIAALNAKLDHFTFATLQTGFKLVTALDALERLTKKGIVGDRAAKMAASYANDIYGSLDWFRVANDVTSKIGRDVAYGFFNPNGRRWAQILMFAPDWTFSTFRAAYKALPGAVDDPALAALHRRYLAKSALYYLTIANGINLITAGHSIFSNENPTRVQLADGRTMQFSKHFMEPMEWLRDPVQTADNKLAFIPRTLMELGTGKEYISAHDAAPDLESRGKLIAESFLPINAQQGLAGGGAESMLGLVGMPIYGKTASQKTEARALKKKQQQEKRRKAAEYYQRQHQ